MSLGVGILLPFLLILLDVHLLLVGILQAFSDCGSARSVGIVTPLGWLIQGVELLLSLAYNGSWHILAFIFLIVVLLWLVFIVVNSLRPPIRVTMRLPVCCVVIVVSEGLLLLVFVLVGMDLLWSLLTCWVLCVVALSFIEAHAHLPILICIVALSRGLCPVNLSPTLLLDPQDVSLEVLPCFPLFEISFPEAIPDLTETVHLILHLLHELFLLSLSPQDLLNSLGRIVQLLVHHL